VNSQRQSGNALKLSILLYIPGAIPIITRVLKTGAGECGGDFVKAGSRRLNDSRQIQEQRRRGKSQEARAKTLESRTKNPRYERAMKTTTVNSQPKAQLPGDKGKEEGKPPPVPPGYRNRVLYLRSPVLPLHTARKSKTIQ
jgi:hypothetical protein